jgi:hypothetical protein
MSEPKSAPADPASTPAPKKPSLRERGREWLDDWRQTDWEVVRTLLLRETLLTVRSRAWARLLAWYAAAVSFLALVPGFYRLVPGRWLHPTDAWWFRAWVLVVAILLFFVVSGWTRRRVARELRGGALEEIVLTGSGPADILLGKVLATLAVAGTLALATLPALLFAAAWGGAESVAVVRVLLTLTLAAYLGLGVGLEALFRQDGTASNLGSAWNWYWLTGVLGAIGSFTQQFCAAGGLLRYPQRWFLAYNPLSALLAAAGYRPQHWVIGFGVFLIFVTAVTLGNLRLLRREWAHGADRVQAAGTLAGLIRAGKREDRAPDLGSDPLPAWERRFGARIRMDDLALGILIAVLIAFTLAAAITGAWGIAGRCCFALFFWLTCLVAAQNGCVALAHDRTHDRWPELALLPLGNWQLLRGKLVPQWEEWRLPALAAAVGLLPAAVAGGGGPAWIAWSALALILLPCAATLLGALLGVLSPSQGEAHFRVSCAFGLLPLLLFAGGLAGLAPDPAALLSPPAAALDSALSGRVPSTAWLGLLLYTAAGAFSLWALSTRLRDWVLAD